jgi:predicted N-acetyltransferase YhbS
MPPTNIDRVTVRTATRDDRPAIEQLLLGLLGVWQSSWRENVVARALDAAHDLAFIAVRDGVVVGFACAHDVGFRGYLSELAVAEPEQNGGIGTALVRAVQSALVARGCTVLIADIYPPAARFYRKLGWSEPKAKILRSGIAMGLRDACASRVRACRAWTQHTSRGLRCCDATGLARPTISGRARGARGGAAQRGAGASRRGRISSWLSLRRHRWPSTRVAERPTLGP